MRGRQQTAPAWAALLALLAISCSVIPAVEAHKPPPASMTPPPPCATPCDNKCCDPGFHCHTNPNSGKMKCKCDKDLKCGKGICCAPGSTCEKEKWSPGRRLLKKEKHCVAPPSPPPSAAPPPPYVETMMGGGWGYGRK